MSIECVNETLTEAEKAFVKELNYALLANWDDDRFNKFANKEINKDKFYLLNEIIYAKYDSGGPLSYSSPLCSAISSGNDARIQLLVDKFKASVKPTSASAPVTASTPEQTTRFKMPSFNISNPFERKKTEGGRRRTRKSRKQRKSRK